MIEINPKLRVMSISGLYHFNQDALESIANSLEKSRRLKVVNLHKTSKDCVQTLKRCNMNREKEIEFKSTSLITPLIKQDLESVQYEERAFTLPSEIFKEEMKEESNLIDTLFDQKHIESTIVEEHQKQLSPKLLPPKLKKKKPKKNEDIKSPKLTIRPQSSVVRKESNPPLKSKLESHLPQHKRQISAKTRENQHPN